MDYRCDRCGEVIDGFEDEGGTSGFYYVNRGSWLRYALPYETVVCDACMWCSPLYIADYGDSSCRSLAKNI